MVKNITLSLPAEIGEEMEKFQEVNWSAVAREAIESYIRLRTKPDLVSIINQLKKERGEEFVKGVDFAKKLAVNIGYSKLSLIIRDYQKRVNAAEEGIAETYGVPPDQVSLPDEERNELMEQVLVSYKVLEETNINDAFLGGLRTTILEIYGELKKVK